MAFANNIGLNEISELSIPLVSDIIQNYCNIKISGISSSMETKSRIPKFGFGFKRTVTSGGGKGTSSNSMGVSRSKSMRVQKSAPLVQVRTKKSNSIDDDEEIVQAAKSLLHPSRGVKKINSISQPNSRSTSPYIEDDSSGSFTKSTTESNSSNDSTFVGSSKISRGTISHKTTSRETTSHGSGSNIYTHNRSRSFTATEKHGIGRPSSAGTRRSTITARPTDIKPNYKGVISQPRGVSQVQRSETHPSSKSSVTDETDGGLKSPLRQSPGVILRNPDSRRSSTGSQSGSGNRRPSSMLSYSVDLNGLASELSNSNEYFESTQPHIPSIRTQSSPIKQVPTPDSPRFSKLRPPISRNSSDGRPSSATALYQQNESQSVSRPRSAAEVHKIQLSRQTSHNSSPSSSGRSTPLSHLYHKGIVEEDEGLEIGNEKRKGSKELETNPRRPTGIQTRTVTFRPGRSPFIRTPKTLKTEIPSKLTENDEESAVGLNELEGAVLLDAEDYRRMLQEVKTLKSILLRLKRELTADGGGVSAPPSSTQTSLKSSTARLKKEGSNQTELLSKIQKLTSERDKALQEVEQSKKKQDNMETAVEKLKKDLEISKREKEKLSSSLSDLESYRENMLAKVERLHADKHKLEDRLNLLEKSAVYESSILNKVWVEHEEFYDESIDDGFDYEDEDATY